MKHLLSSWVVAIFLMATSVELVAAESAVCPPYKETPKVFTIKSSTDSGKLEDPSRFIKDFNTDLVVENFFKTPDTLFNFLRFVYQKVDRKIAEYRTKNNIDDNGIVFIFKGGNVMRMIANNLLYHLRPDARDLLKERYAPFFKRSDADFGILINPDNIAQLRYEKVMDDMINLAYESLNEMRVEFEKSPAKYFNFFQYNNEYASQLFADALKRLNESEALKDPENKTWLGSKFLQYQLNDVRGNKDIDCDYHGQFDYQTKFSDADTKVVISTRLNDKPNWIKNTVNQALEFYSDEAKTKKVKFNLVRSKIQIQLAFQKPGQAMQQFIEGAEAVDISLSDREDYRMTPEFWKNIDHDLAFYVLKFDKTNEEFKLRSESMAGVFKDLHDVVFGQFDRPWSGKKWEKRVNRMFFFSIVEMLTTTGTGTTEIDDYLKAINNGVVEPLSKILPLKDDAKTKADEILRNAQTLAKEHKDFVNANAFFISTAQFVVNQLVANPEESDLEKLNEYMKIVQENLDTMTKLNKLEGLKVDPDSLYKVEMQSLF